MKTFQTISQAKKLTKLSYLGGVNISQKIIKSQKVNGIMIYCVYLAPANQSGYNVCSHATDECKIGCLSTSGRAKMELTADRKMIANARITKTKLFHENQTFFMDWLIAEIKSNLIKSANKNMEFAVRLNGTSDIDWARVKHNGLTIFEIFPDIQFYDYSKVPSKFFNKPINYHLTFSYTGRNWNTCDILLKKGENVAMVFDIKKGGEFPQQYGGYKVIDGDLSDYRPLDGKGVIVGLRFKHIANKEHEKEVINSVFVVKG